MYLKLVKVEIISAKLGPPKDDEVVQLSLRPPTLKPLKQDCHSKLSSRLL